MCALSFLKGDMFIVHNDLEDGWMWVANVRTEEQGLIVEDLVEEVVSKTQSQPARATVGFTGDDNLEYNYNNFLKFAHKQNRRYWLLQLK